MENSDAFDKRKEAYVQNKQALFSEYMQREAQNKELNLFFCLNSSAEERDKRAGSTFSISNLKHLLANPLEAIHNGGYFLRWNKKGIIINPAKGFLQRFCELGHHLWDIDAIIVTSPDTKSCADLELIHSLNRELNNSLASYEQDPHVIHYLLHPAIHALFAAKLRPHFREEKGSVICLETFQDGYAEERYTLDPTIKLWYSKKDTSLMIRLELSKEPDQEESISFGYLTGASWDDSCRSFFKECALLLLGFGQTSQEDLENLGQQKRDIGYFGLAKAVKELPKLKTLLVSEFCPCQGDIRLEVIKKLKKETSAQENSPALWPLEQGFCLHMESHEIRTAAPDQFRSCDEVRIVQCEEAFGPLLYLPKELVL